MIARVAFLAALTVGATGAMAQAPLEKPLVLKRFVFDGKLADLQGAFARVVGLKKGGDGFVSVRAAPSTKAAERDRLTLGRLVWTMPVEKGSSFVAVIYAEGSVASDDMEKQCNLPNPPPASFPASQIYSGPCKHGWVHKRFVEVLAD